MLPLDLIRADPERVKRSAALKGEAAPVDELVAVDGDWRRAQTEAEQSRAEQNRISREFGRTKDQALLPQMRALATQVKEQMARVSRGEDPLGVIREKHDRIDLPCEKNKFDAGGSFAIQFIERASSRFSPQADALKKLHISAVGRVSGQENNGHGNRQAVPG